MGQNLAPKQADSGNELPPLPLLSGAKKRKGGEVNRRPTTDHNTIGAEMRFERASISKLISARRSVDRRIGKADWRMANDPMANLARLSTLVDELMEKSASLTKAIDHELAVDERRALRQALLANCR
jgi:hypothetical protein